MIADAVVPVAGLGTRLRPLTRALPKELLPVARAPVIEHVVRELADAGIERVVLVTRRGKQAIVDHLDGLEDLPCDVMAVRQAEPRGLGDAIACARAALPDDVPFAVALGDTLVENGPQVMRRLIAAADDKHADVVIALEHVEGDEISRYGVAAPEGRVLSGNGAIPLRGLVEKPSPADAPSDLAIASRYVLPFSIFDALSRVQPGVGGELQLTDALQLLIDEGARAVGVPLREGEARHDVGSMESYTAAFLRYALIDPELGPVIREQLADG
ncbi:UTP--glucose-1-phosphate uridylyltransferase [Svornostia abyssi]|uniref:UTP--glucose-1-phosphate uridylyltransferase n=1 Tax=Svornostia abyssi TaxID=2898438 RepID=A0ABY5PIM8_9ACTN|nr:UTP--glucose-1-phosphate uridylyltransferase [Parviterribacteraceae bacterium J379]